VPNIKAAEKWQRQTERRAQRNLDVKTRLKTLFKKAKAAPDLAPGVESQYDKAAGKGIIHPNKAARKKARLARALRAAQTAVAAPTTRKRSPAKKK
jgi:small subunit ribosomal protein S20